MDLVVEVVMAAVAATAMVTVGIAVVRVVAGHLR